MVFFNFENGKNLRCPRLKFQNQFQQFDFVKLGWDQDSSSIVVVAVIVLGVGTAIAEPMIPLDLPQKPMLDRP